MKMTSITKLLLALGLLIALAVGCNREGIFEEQAVPSIEESKLITYSENAIDGQYIIVFNDDALPLDFRAAMPYEQSQSLIGQEAKKVMDKHSIADRKLAYTYSYAVQGFTLSDLTEAEVQKLLADPASA